MPQNRIQIQIEGIDKFSQTLEKLERTLSSFSSKLDKINKSFNKVVSTQEKLQDKLTKIYEKGSVKRLSVVNKETVNFVRLTKEKIRVLKELNDIIGKYYAKSWKGVPARKKYDLLNTWETYKKDIIHTFGKELTELPEPIRIRLWLELEKQIARFKQFRKDLEEKQIRIKTRIESKELLEQYKTLKKKISFMLSEAFSNVTNLKRRDLKPIIQQIHEFEKLGKQLWNKSYITKGQFQRDLIAITSRFKQLNKIVQTNTNVVSSWWKRFAEVAVGFTIMYRIMNAIENAIRRFARFLKQTVENFDEMVNVTYRMAMMYQFFGNSTVSFAESVKYATSVTQSLRLAMINSTASIDDVIAGLDELAQHGVFITNTASVKAYADFMGFVSMIATSVGASRKQVKQEIQSLFEGRAVAGNTLIRFLKNLEKTRQLADGTVKSLQKATNVTERFNIIVQKIVPAFQNMNKAVFEMSSEKAFMRLQNILYLLSDTALRIVNLRRLGDQSKNVFADMWNTIAGKFFNLDKLEKFTSMLNVYNSLVRSISSAKAKGKLSIVADLEIKKESIKKQLEEIYSSMFTERGKKFVMDIAIIFNAVVISMQKLISAAEYVFDIMANLVLVVQAIYSQYKGIIDVTLKWVGKIVLAVTLAKALSFSFKIITSSVRILYNTLVIIPSSLGKILTKTKLIKADTLTILTSWFKIGVAISVAAFAIYEMIKTVRQRGGKEAKSAGTYIGWKFAQGVNSAMLSVLQEMAKHPALNHGNWTKVGIKNLKENLKIIESALEEHSEDAKKFAKSYMKNLTEDIRKLWGKIGDFLNKHTPVGKLLKLIGDVKAKYEEVIKLTIPKEGFPPTKMHAKKVEENTKDILSSLSSLISGYQQLYKTMRDLNLYYLNPFEGLSISLNEAKEKVFRFIIEYKRKLIEQYKSAQTDLEKSQIELKLFNLDITERKFRFESNSMVKIIKTSVKNVSNAIDESIANVSKEGKVGSAIRDLFLLKKRLQDWIKTMKAYHFDIFDKKSLEDAQKTLEKINQALDEAKDKMGGFKSAWKHFIEIFKDKATIQMKITEEYSKAIANTYDSLVTNLANTFTKFVLRQGFSLKKFMINVLQDIIKILSELTVRIVVMRTMLGIFGEGSIIGKVLGGMFGIKKAAMGGIFEGGFMSVKGFATGGIVDRPTIGIVGEGKYNEAVVPLPDGRSIPVQFKQPARPNVIVNIENKSGIPIQAEQVDVHFNGKDYIISAVIEALATRPDFRNVVKNQLQG